MQETFAINNILGEGPITVIRVLVTNKFLVLFAFGRNWRTSFISVRKSRLQIFTIRSLLDTDLTINIPIVGRIGGNRYSCNYYGGKVLHQKN